MNLLNYYFSLFWRLGKSHAVMLDLSFKMAVKKLFLVETQEVFICLSPNSNFHQWQVNIHQTSHAQRIS